MRCSPPFPSSCHGPCLPLSCASVREIERGMDAIRKKMHSLKSETDGLCAIIDGFERATKKSAAKAEQVHIRRLYLKKGLSILTTGEVIFFAGWVRYQGLYQEGAAAWDQLLRDQRQARPRPRGSGQELRSHCQDDVWQVTTSRNWTSWAGNFGVQETELKRALERAENKLKSIVGELETVGQNMKQLEKSAEKGRE